MALHIENARAEDKAAVVGLLQQGNLLTDDLPADLPDFIIAKEQDACVGVAGLELFGPIALLRSVAVDPSYQGKQVGSQLVGHLLETAKSTGLNELYLITTTADRYFERHGFRIIPRQDVPQAIQQTQQFSDLCPSSAIVMKRLINQQEA